MVKVQRICHVIAGRQVLAAVALSLLAVRSDADEVFAPKHVAKISAVASAVISPDGSHVAYMRYVPRDIMKEESGSSWTEIHVVDADGASRAYVSGKTSVGGVRWTPDGRAISFLTKRQDDEQRSLYVIPLGGGEARKVLEHGASISSYAWSPDGKRVAFLAREVPDKKKEELKKKGFNQQIYEEDWTPVRVWMASVSLDGSAGSQDDKPRALELDGHAADLSWSPTGGNLLVSLSPTSLVDDSYMKRRLHVVSVETGKVTARLRNPGKLGASAWSPDGKHIAFITGEDENDPKDGRLRVVSVGGGSHVDVVPSYDGHVSGMVWRDSSRLLFVGDEGCGTVVGEVGRDGKGRKVLLAAGERIWRSPTIAGSDTVVLLGESSRHPHEVFLWKVGQGEPRRLTDTNPWLEGMRFARQEVVRHKAKDGLDLEGILVRPLDEEAGKRYPLILTVHGGPEAHIRNGWVTRYSYAGQVAAARGFAVFYPNYRGSTGRGVAFSKMGQADAAGKEFSDLIDAVDHLVAIGLVDKDRVGITGGSYGGYASAWGATYYSHRFAASVMFVGISSNISKVGTTDIPLEMYLVHHRKWLWDDWKYFLERSPIYHVQKGRTPILILHGKDDPRVHPSQSLELYRHLKTLGKAPVRLVFYPGEGHGNRKSAARYDYSLRLLRWMDHYLKGPGGDLPPHEIDYDLQKPQERVASRRRL